MQACASAAIRWLPIPLHIAVVILHPRVIFLTLWWGPVVGGAGDDECVAGGCHSGHHHLGHHRAGDTGTPLRTTTLSPKKAASRRARVI